MGKGNFWILRVVTLLALLTINSPALGQFKPASGIETLTELKGIYFSIKNLDPDSERSGLSSGRIDRVFLRQFERAGIQLFSEKEYERLVRSQTYPLARLELQITPYDIEGAETRIYEITLRAQQLVRLLRKPIIRLWATTWENKYITLGSDLENLRKRSSELINRFIRAYSSMNSSPR